jgi:hypothetical protein
MNKYLKTYIRNREIAIERHQNLKEYELEYIDKVNLRKNNIQELIRNSREPDKIINILGDKGRNYIINLVNYEFLYNLLKNSKESSKIVDIFLNNQKYISNYDDNFIKNLFIFSKEPDKVLKLLGDKGRNYIVNLDNAHSLTLFIDSKEPDKIINLLDEEVKNYIKNYVINLNDDGINRLLKNSEEPSKILNSLRNFGIDIISKINTGKIFRDFYNPEKFIDIILNSNHLINGLSDDDIGSIFRYSKEHPDKIFNKLGSRGKLYINNINKYKIEYIINSIREPRKEELKQIIKKYRPDLNIE